MGPHYKKRNGSTTQFGKIKLFILVGNENNQLLMFHYMKIKLHYIKSQIFAIGTYWKFFLLLQIFVQGYQSFYRTYN